MLKYGKRNDAGIGAYFTEVWRIRIGTSQDQKPCRLIQVTSDNMGFAKTRNKDIAEGIYVVFDQNDTTVGARILKNNTWKPEGAIE
jgi:hypothetical protein